MSTITIDDQTRVALETKAKEQGMSVPAYLRWVSQADKPRTLRSLATGDDDARQSELRRRMMEIIAEAERATPEPNRPLGQSGEFADAMFEKYRR